MKKYKLINKTTKEETICTKVNVDGFDYYVSDNNINQGDYYIDFRTDGNKLEHFKEKDDWVLVGICNSKKVIATTNPNINISKVIDEVEELALNTINNNYNFEDERYKINCMYGFIDGYNKHKENNHFSEEDMIEFGLCAATFPITPYKTVKEIFNIWKEQKVETIYYE